MYICTCEVLTFTWANFRKVVKTCFVNLESPPISTKEEEHDKTKVKSEPSESSYETKTPADTEVVRWINTSVIPESENRDNSSSSYEKSIDTSLTDENTNLIKIDGVKSIKSPPKNVTNFQTKILASPEQHKVKAIPSTSAVVPTFSMPSQPVCVTGQQIQMVQYRAPVIPFASEFPIRFGTRLIPVHYVPEHAKETVNEVVNSKETFIPISSIQPIIIPHIPNTQKRPREILYPVPLHIPVNSTDIKTDQSGHRIKIQRTDASVEPIPVNPISVPLPSFSVEHPWFENYLKNVHMELEAKELWNDFHKHGTEMILTRIGR